MVDDLTVKFIQAEILWYFRYDLEFEIRLCGSFDSEYVCFLLRKVMILQERFITPFVDQRSDSCIYCNNKNNKLCGVQNESF